MKYRSTSLDIYTWPFTTLYNLIHIFMLFLPSEAITWKLYGMQLSIHFWAGQTNHSWESTPSCDGSLGQSTWRSWSRRILGHRPLLRPLLIELNGGRYFGPMEKIYPRVNSHITLYSHNICGKLMVSLGKSSTISWWIVFASIYRRWSPQGPPSSQFFQSSTLPCLGWTSALCCSWWKMMIYLWPKWWFSGWLR